MSQIPREHRETAPQSVRCAVVTVSDTRTPETDRGGPLVAEMLLAAGHLVVERRITPDEPTLIRDALTEFHNGAQIDAVLLTGGTGIASRDQTFETLTALFTKSLPGYGELFRALSFQEIGPAAMLSRAVGGVMSGMIVLSMPGSPAAVRLAMEKIILPELGHLMREARR